MSKKTVSREEQESVARSLREAMDVFSPSVAVLREKGYLADVVADETTDTVTLTLVVHTKWLTT